MSKIRTQVNVRLSEEIIEKLDKKRMKLQPELGKIPTRSDVMRYALEDYLTENTNKSVKAKK